MKYRRFLKPGVATSEIGFGLWTVSTGWWGNKTEDDAVRLLHRAFDYGIIFYDTADTYGNGKGETLLAKAFREFSPFEKIHIFLYCPRRDNIKT